MSLLSKLKSKTKRSVKRGGSSTKKKSLKKPVKKASVKKKSSPKKKPVKKSLKKPVKKASVKKKSSSSKKSVKSNSSVKELKKIVVPSGPSVKAVERIEFDDDFSSPFSSYEELTVTCKNCGVKFTVFKIDGVKAEGLLCNSCSFGDIDDPDN